MADEAKVYPMRAREVAPRAPGHAIDALNPAQARAVAHHGGALLVVAGAGTGKTNTLAHRVAHLVLQGVAPERILLLTFTRRAALEMTRRAQRILAAARGQVSGGDRKSTRLNSSH